MPELDPLLSVIVRCVFGGHYEESYWKDDCLQKLIQLNRLCKSYQSIHSKQKMQLLMEAKASTNCTHRGTELIKSWKTFYTCFLKYSFSLLGQTLRNKSLQWNTGWWMYWAWIFSYVRLLSRKLLTKSWILRWMDLNVKMESSCMNGKRGMEANSLLLLRSWIFLVCHQWIQQL